MRTSSNIRRTLAYAAMLGQARTITPDNLAFFPEINLVFNRVKKSGNTSLVLFLEELTDPTGINARSAEDIKLARSVQRTALKNILRIRSFQSLLCVRNPVIRALSGFLDIVASGRISSFVGKPGYGNPTAEGFEDFLTYLSEIGVRSSNRHFWTQSDLLFQDPQRFTYIVRLENIVSDMEHALEELGLSRSSARSLESPHSIEKAQPNKITNSDQKRDLVTTRANRLIENIYAEDFDAFGY